MHSNEINVRIIVRTIHISWFICIFAMRRIPTKYRKNKIFPSVCSFLLRFILNDASQWSVIRIYYSIVVNVVEILFCYFRWPSVVNEFLCVGSSKLANEIFWHFRFHQKCVFTTCLPHVQIDYYHSLLHFWVEISPNKSLLSRFFYLWIRKSMQNEWRDT